MNNELRTIVVVDNDPTICQLLMSILDGKFDVIPVDEKIQNITTVVTERDPCCILLDVDLTTNSGRSLCHSIKSEHATKTLPVIVLSSDNSEDNVARCFDNGADEFITKPLSKTTVIHKIETILKYDTLINSLQYQSNELSELVNTTMSQASSYGSVLNMVKRINLCHSEQTIAQAVFDYLSTEGLSASIYFKSKYESNCYDQKSRVCSPMIRELFDLAHNRKRIHTLGNRLLISDKHVSILIKNPPIEGSEQYGIFIDVVAVIIEALEARYLGLLREQRLSMLDAELSHVILELHESVEDVRVKKQKLIDDIVLKIGLSFHELEMTEQQEEFFSELLESTVMGHDDNNNIISKLQEKLSTLVEQIHDLVVEADKSENAEANQVVKDDVELF